MKHVKKQEGITLFVTLVLMGVLLGVSASLLNITLKQYQLAGVSYASEIAFQAANAGMECALFNDWVTKTFEVGDTRDTVTCFSGVDSVDETPIGSHNDVDPVADSSEEQRFRFTWSSSGSNQVCTEFSVYKFYVPATSPDPAPVVEIDGELFRTNPCPKGSVCTVIQSRGYNVPCGDRLTAPRVVEREYTYVY